MPVFTKFISVFSLTYSLLLLFLERSKVETMARPSLEIIDVIRTTADQIDESREYQWGHMGACNCGFLAQAVTRLSKGEIHRRAMQGYGDWNEQLNDYCPGSGMLFDDVITALLHIGFDTDDLKQLENLNGKDILDELPGVVMRRNNRDDVILYLRTWADLLERKLLQDIRIPPIGKIQQSEIVFA
jgi:hypothetical protein